MLIYPLSGVVVVLVGVNTFIKRCSSGSSVENVVSKSVVVVCGSGSGVSQC